MSRFRRVVHSVASGYVLLAMTAAYSLASVPLALHYLSTDRFGLWTLMAGISGYLSLIDLGMSSSLSRLLVDHKDEKQAGAYGSLIKTGTLVLVIQAVVIVFAGFVLAPVLSRLLAIQPDLVVDFIRLMRWQTANLALGLVLRIFSHLLLAHQRVDVNNYCQIANLAANFALLWIFFHLGQGVLSLAWASLLSTVFGTIVPMAACWKLRLFPPPGAWGKATWEQFREIFGFGKDLFLASVGYQMLSASQTIIITRRLGLAESALWYAGTRAFTLVSWAIWRISDVSGPAFAEMIVRGERVLLQERYKSMVILSSSLSGAAAICYALCNSLFVFVWTHQKGHGMEWPPFDDVLLGIWMIIMTLVHAHNGFVLLTKKVGFVRYIYFVEGVVFVLACLLTTGWGGLRAIIICSIVCSTVFTGTYGVWRISDFFNLSFGEVAFGWLQPMGRVLLRMIPFAACVWWMFGIIQNPIQRLALNTLFSGMTGFYILLRYGLPPGFREELLRRAPRQITFVLSRVLAITKSARAAEQ